MHIIAIVRLRTDPRTKAHVAGRIADGHSKLEAIRCLKRYIACEVFTRLRKRQREIDQTQYAAQKYRRRLAAAKLAGAMGRRGNPYDDAMMESLMKTVKVEGVSPLAFETEDDVAEPRPRFIDA